MSFVPIYIQFQTRATLCRSFFQKKRNQLFAPTISTCSEQTHCPWWQMTYTQVPAQPDVLTMLDNEERA